MPDARVRNRVQRVPVTTLSVLRSLPGGSKSLLMLDQECVPWVVKLLNNPQHKRTLVNELVASRIGMHLGLSLPHVAPVFTDSNSVEPHCGIRFAGGLMPGFVVDWSAACKLPQIRNRSELPGIALLDLWLHNTDRRQLVLTRTSRQSTYKAVFVDQGYCFGGPEWNLNAPGYAYRFSRTCEDLKIVTYRGFEGWLQKIEQLSPECLEECTTGIPTAWLENDSELLKQLIQDLQIRRVRLRKLLEAVWSSHCKDRLGKAIQSEDFDNLGSFSPWVTST